MIQIPATERLQFSFITERDAELLYQLDHDPEVMKYLTSGRTSSKEQVINEFLPRLARYADQTLGHGLWLVSDVINNEPYGWVLVRPMGFFSDSPQRNNLELGWRFFKKHWGKGIATEAAKTVMETLLQQRAIKQYSATALVDNIASIAIMKKLGMNKVSDYIHKDDHGEFFAVEYSVTLADPATKQK